jgi:hypothetical protein
MGLFDLFKKPQTIQDDCFGTLTFMSFKDTSKNYFEGKGKFKPTGDEIEYFIDGEFSGPTAEQRNFYNKVQDSYGEIISKIIPLIEDEFKNWKDDFKIKDFKKEFKLVAVTIPRLNSGPANWDMSFETIHDDNHQITIDFKDFDPEGVLIDG